MAISFEGSRIHPPGLREYVVIYGQATIEEGGAPELLQELARVYLGPDVRFPPMDDPPPGVRLRIAVERVNGSAPGLNNGQAFPATGPGSAHARAALRPRSRGDLQAGQD